MVQCKSYTPKRATLWSAGYDLSSAEKVTIGSRCTATVSADIGMKFGCKLVGKICSRSSLSARSIEVGAGLVNSGIIYVVLHNLLCEEVTFKIAQIVFEKMSLPILTEVFDFIDQTERDMGGFGSTNRE